VCAEIHLANHQFLHNAGAAEASAAEGGDCEAVICALEAIPHPVPQS
jgi:hypothetical protein